MQNYLSKKMTI